MFENLSDRLQEIIKKTSGNSELTEENMSDSLREIRRALLEADVNLKVVKAFISNIKTRAEGEEVLKGVNPAQQLVKIVNDELVTILGGQNEPLNLNQTPTIIMMLGLQGSGKTTSSAKLAVKLKKEGKPVDEIFARMREIGDTIAKGDAKINEYQTMVTDFVAGLPNMPDEDLLPGEKENNQVVKVYGTKPEFDFEAKNHVDLCTALNLIDYERGVKLSGGGHWLYRGDGA